jgi:hypothetical protein
MPVVVDCVLAERSARGRALPKIVVETFWWEGIGFLSDRTSKSLEEGSSQIDFSNRAGVQLLDGGLKARAASALRSDLDATSVLVGGGNHPFSFLRIVASGLFYIHMLARFATKDRSRSVPVVGSGAEERV